MSREQKIRSFLFYLSVAIFFVGLPFILSFSLGYKLDRRTLKFTRAGLIDLKTQPTGASVHLDGRLLNDKTPATLNELLPGPYNIRLEIENHYPWLGEVIVEAGKVSRLDKIILFPLRPNVKQISQERASNFWVEKEKIYYLNDEENRIFTSDLEGEHFKEAGRFPEMTPPPKKWKVSPDKEKILFFNPRQIVVVYLEPHNKTTYGEFPVVLDFPEHRLSDVFWYSDSYHLILVADRTIDVVEAKPKAEAINLASLNKRNAPAFYDEDTDILYFVDAEKAPDAKVYDNVYKLNLSTKSSPFRELIKPKTNE